MGNEPPPDYKGKSSGKLRHEHACFGRRLDGSQTRPSRGQGSATRAERTVLCDTEAPIPGRPHGEPVETTRSYPDPAPRNPRLRGWAGGGGAAPTATSRAAAGSAAKPRSASARGRSGDWAHRPRSCSVIGSRRRRSVPRGTLKARPAFARAQPIPRPHDRRTLSLAPNRASLPEPSFAAISTDPLFLGKAVDTASCGDHGRRPWGGVGRVGFRRYRR